MTLLVIASLAGCTPGLKDGRFATGSATMVANRSHDALVAVNVDDGTISRFEPRSGRVDEVAVGLRPTRIASVGDTEFWVTLRGERAVAVVDEVDGKLRADGRIEVGPEPYGIVASEDGTRVYVALSQAGQIVALDGQTRLEVDRFDVPADPRWLALHPNDQVLYVGCGHGATLVAIDLPTGEVQPIALPEGTRLGMDQRTWFPLRARITGDLAILPDGTQLGVPTLYVDDTTSLDPIPPTLEAPTRSNPYYGSPPSELTHGVLQISEIGGMNPILVTIPLDELGLPVAFGVRSVFVGAGEREVYTRRSYPTSVIGSPRSNQWVVTMEGSAATIVLLTESDASRGPEDYRRRGRRPEPAPIAEDGTPIMPFSSLFDGGFEVRDSAVVETGRGPDGVAFLDDAEAYAHSWLGRAITDLETERVEDGLGDPGNWAQFYGGRGLVPITGRVSPVAGGLSDEARAGEALFYTATDTRMVAPGAGVSCATCHFEGRDDGISWVLDGQPRQTPSLAGGNLDRTAPLTWSDGIADVSAEVNNTAKLRMGGTGLTAQMTRELAAYLMSLRYPDRAPADEDQVALGAQVFARPDVGCIDCHSGELYTDNQAHLLFGDLPTQTPTLRGIGATAPYLHDGSVPDLRGVVNLAATGIMGDTSALTEEEREALVAYLASL